MHKPFFWLHITKSGGHSLRKALDGVYIETNRLNPQPFLAIPKKEWNDNLNNYRLPLGNYDFKRALFAKKFLYPEEWNNIFKFVIVRNPYDRVVSSWLYSRNNGNYRSKLKKCIKNPSLLINPKADFQVFLETIPKAWSQKQKYRHLATHTARIIPDITDKNGQNILFDFVGRLENINNDFDYICNQIAATNNEFPILNSARRRIHYSHFYNKTTLRLVEDYYGDDIERLGYQFNKSSKSTFVFNFS